MAHQLRSMPKIIVSGRPTSFAYRFRCNLILTFGAYCCFGFSLFAQTNNSQPTEKVPKQWQSTTEVKNDSLLQERIPVRIIEDHSQSGDGTLDKRSVEIRGTDGHFEPYQEIESETQKIDDSTGRTTIRTFARDVNGRRSLVQITEEEKKVFAGGDSKTVRLTYNPDANGKLQLVQREIVETKKIGDDLEETNSTVMLTNINGGLAPAFKAHEIRKRAAYDTVETEKTTWLPDVNGKWQVSEIRKNIATQEPGERKVEETVFRPDADGKLSQVSCVLSHEFNGNHGEKWSSAEAYSIDLPGTPRDGKLHLIERTTSNELSNSNGERVTDQALEQPNSGDPTADLRLSVLVNGDMVPTLSGEESTLTVRARDSNGSFGIVSVDTTKSDRIPAILIQQTPSEQPKANQR